MHVSILTEDFDKFNFVVRRSCWFIYFIVANDGRISDIRYILKLMPSSKTSGIHSFQAKFNIVRDVIIIIGVFFAGGSMLYAGNQTKIVGEQLAETRKVTSAEFTHELNVDLDNTQYDDLVTAIEGDNSPHPGSYPILKTSGGQFSKGYIDGYVSKLDDVSNLWQDGLIDEHTAYNEFAYNMEKTWCNADIQKYILSERKTDGNFVGDKAYYSAFQNMAMRFLTLDNKQCSDLDKE